MSFCCIFSHFMYRSLVTIFFFKYIVFFFPYIRWCMFFTLSHMYCLFSLFIHMFLLLYSLSMFHTWCIVESCLSVSVKTGCKSIIPWSLFLQSFSRVCSRVRLMYFCKLWVVVLDISHNCCLWFCHELPKGEIVRVICFVIG